MKLTKAQRSALSDVCKEAAAVVLGGLVIGGILAQKVNWVLTGSGFVLYLVLVALALYFKKNGE